MILTNQHLSGMNDDIAIFMYLFCHLQKKNSDTAKFTLTFLESGLVCG